MSLAWLSDRHKEKIENALPMPAEATLSGENAPVEDGNRGAGRGDPVKDGQEGIDGLAQALGSVPRSKNAAGQAADEGPEVKKRRTEDEKATREDLEDDQDDSDLKQVLLKRQPAQPDLSALRMNADKRKKKKKKKKDKKHREGKDKRDSSSSSDLSSTTDSLFHLAAMPVGIQKLERLHQEKPGALANLTLKRFEELLAQATGMGSAHSGKKLPAVARGYLAQIYLVRNPESSIGLRSLRELRTLATIADLIATNDGLRALDVVLQRMKAIELFVSQGNWGQASQLELVTQEGSRGLGSGKS